MLLEIAHAHWADFVSDLRALFYLGASVLYSSLASNLDVLGGVDVFFREDGRTRRCRATLGA
jgi:hypothetical protein